ncbi:MAG TPA: c-type cytochrome, partial [Chromatiaceae bacterium]|nr:c-type cytochrome [Chromatiaceae bacterium]
LIFLFMVLAQVSLAGPDGKALYEEHCSACHGGRGEGGIGLPLTAAILAQLSDDYIAKTIRFGRPGRIMPSFEALSDAQVGAILKHLRGWSGKPAPVYAGLAVKGDPAKGKPLYEEHCQRCHGKDGSGEGSGTGVTLSREREFRVMPAALNNRGFQRAASDAMIADIVLKGRKVGGMPSFANKLSGEQIAHLVAYVRTLKSPPPPRGIEEWRGRAVYVMESPYGFDETVEALKQALTGANFRIFPARYLEQGLTDEFSHNTRQLGIRFCNFKELYHLLNIEPRLGTVLPCRINVIEHRGTVLLISPNVVEVSRLFNNQELTEVAVLMEEIILSVMEEATL